jgi:hypothetical protein
MSQPRCPPRCGCRRSDLPGATRRRRQARGRAPGSVDVWTAAGAAHIGALCDSGPGDWEERVVSFLDAALEPPAGTER